MGIQRPQDKYFVADMFSRTMDIGNLRGVAVDVSTVHDFHGSSDNPTLNGTLPAIVSTSGRIHGELLRLLFNLADKKTSNSLAALGEALDVESEVYCRRRSGNFWRMRAALGLACAQAATLGTQVVGRPRSRPRYAARPRH